MCGELGTDLFSVVFYILDEKLPFYGGDLFLNKGMKLVIDAWSLLLW